MAAPDPARYPCLNLSAGGFPQAEGILWESCKPMTLLDVVTGKDPFLATECRIFRDDKAQMLYVRFKGQDDEVHSTFGWRDEPLYRQDVFELFLCDGTGLDRYREIEVSPYDVWFDGDISYHGSERRLNMDWDIKGFATRTQIDRPNLSIVSVWAIPYQALREAPKAGASWRFNVFRVDHSQRGEALMAWQPTGAPNFHVPEVFGHLDFLP